MVEGDLSSGEALLELQATKMPFGEYEGRAVLELPEPYLLWFRQKGFPRGKLGQMMALALEIKINGLEKLVADACGSGRTGRLDMSQSVPPYAHANDARRRTR